MGRLFWVIWVGSKCSDKCPYKREAEGDLRENREDHAIVDGDIEQCGHKPRSAGNHQKLEEARNGVSPGDSRRTTDVLTP